MTDKIHQISAFAVSRKRKAGTIAAYALYDNGELVITRTVRFDGISEHRALLMAVWSAIAYHKHRMPQEFISVYCDDATVPNELTDVWYGTHNLPCDKDRDRIDNIMRDSCFINGVAFGVCRADDADGYSKRMQSLIENIQP